MRDHPRGPEDLDDVDRGHPGGQQVPLAEIIKTWQAEQAEKAVMAQNTISPEDEIEIDGKKVKAQELIDCYARNVSKANEVPEKKEEVKENAKKGIDNFKKIENAMRSGSDEFKIVISTEAERLKIGNAKYGSKGGK